MPYLPRAMGIWKSKGAGALGATAAETGHKTTQWGAAQHIFHSCSVTVSIRSWARLGGNSHEGSDILD